MGFKTITYIINKDEIKDNVLLVKKFFLELDNKSVIIGQVLNNNNEVIPQCAVILQEYDEDSHEYIDKNIAYTNDKGFYGICTTLQADKDYKIVVYAPNNLN